MIAVSLYGRDSLYVRPLPSLEDDRKATLREVLEGQGAYYVRHEQQWVTDRKSAASVLQALIDAGFSIPPVLQRWIDEMEIRAHYDQLAAEKPEDTLDQRLTKLDPNLKLRDYQREGIAWLKEKFKALLCDEPGLGKSAQALLSLPYEHRARGELLAPVLVVCPANAKPVWEEQTRKWRPDMRTFTLEGQGTFRWPASGEIVILNYDILPDVGDVHTSPPAGCIVIGDEAHYCKTQRRQRTIRFKGLAELARSGGGRTWLLTGTPLLSHPLDLWSLCSCAGLADTFGLLKEFKAMFGMVTKQHACRQCGHKDEATDKGDCPAKKGKKRCDCDNHVTETTEWGSPSPEVAERFNKIALRRLRQDVAKDIPLKQYESIPVVLAAAVKADIDADLAPGWEEAIENAIETQAGVSFTEMSAARADLAEAKIPAMLEFVENYEEQDTPLLVFSAHTAPLLALEDREGWGLIMGETSTKERGRLVAEFQEGKLKGLGLNIKAGGTAITLHRASHALFVDREWNPGDNLQAEDRIARIGQGSKSVMIHRLVADHRLDQRLAEILDAKTKMIVESLGK